MSFIVSSGEGISKNLQNHSTAKQMYSFPKTKRFIVTYKNTSDTFQYNLPCVMGKRSASIGYGMKSDFTKPKKWNAPYYKIGRLYDDNKDEAPKYTFGLSREYFQKVVVGKDSSEINRNSPGPGRYDCLNLFGSQSPKYTMVKRYATMQLGSTVKYPGPGKYNNNMTINTSGKFPLSQFSNTVRAGWSLSKDKRFRNKSPPTPGPNKYNIDSLIKGKPTIFNSRYHSPTARSLSGKYASIFNVTSTTPGPGSYITFSEFGIYRGKNGDENKKKCNLRKLYDFSDKKKMARSQSTANTFAAKI